MIKFELDYDSIEQIWGTKIMTKAEYYKKMLVDNKIVERPMFKDMYGQSHFSPNESYTDHINLLQENAFTEFAKSAPVIIEDVLYELETELAKSKFNDTLYNELKEAFLKLKRENEELKKTK